MVGFGGAGEVYAELFYSRARALKAAQAADERLRIRIGSVSIGKRRQMLDLPSW